MRNSSVIGSLLLGTGINLVGLAFRFLFVFLQSIIAVRLYGAELFGVYVISVSIVNLLSYTGQFGFSRTIVRYVAKYIVSEQWHSISWLLWSMMAVTTVWSIVIAVVLNYYASSINQIFDEVEVTGVLLLVGFAIPGLTVATLLAAFTQGFGVMQYKVIMLDIVAPALEVVLLFLLWYTGEIQQGLMYSYTISLIVVCFLLAIVCFKFLRNVRQKCQGSTPCKHGNLKEIVGFTFFAWLSLQVRHAVRPVNMLIVGALGTATMVGHYSVLERLVAVGVIFQMSINSMLAPLVSQLVERNEVDQLCRVYILVVRWSLVVCLPFFLLLGIHGEQVLGLFGVEFVANSHALWWLSAMWVFSLLIGPADVILMMSGRSQHSAINQIIMLLLLVGFGWWLIPKWGIMGAISSFIVSTVAVNVLRILQLRYYVGIHPFDIATVKVLVAGFLMFCGLIVIPLAVSMESAAFGWLPSVLFGVGGAAIFLLSLILLGLEDEEVVAFEKISRRWRISRRKYG